MASSSSIDSRCTKHGLVFLVGHGLMVLGFIFFTVGFATLNWVSSGSFIYGLWGHCFSSVCDHAASNGTFESWMLATRAMQTMALICYMVGVLLALFFNCAAQVMSGHTYTSKARVLEIFTFVGNFLCLIGVSVYGSYGDHWGILKYSYALSVFSLFLTTPGVIMVALSRNHVSGARSGVEPDCNAQAAVNGTSVTVISSPQCGESTSVRDGPCPLYGGRSQQYPDNSSSNTWRDSRDCGSVVSYPYGQGRGDSGAQAQPHPFPSSLTRPLPYPLHPEGPDVGFVPMPEPGGVEGDGYGNPRVPGRLPPITNPSAPPPIDDMEQPPSYLEAIGHYNTTPHARQDRS